MRTRWGIGLAACVAIECLALSTAGVHADTAAYTGAGQFDMTVNYSTTPATVLQPTCGSSAFTIGGGSQLLVVSATSVASGGLPGYEGPVTFSGSGSSTCESTAVELLSNFTMSITSTGDPTLFNCASITGVIVRVGAAQVMEMGGSCSVQGAAADFSFFAAGAWEPIVSYTGPCVDGVCLPLTGSGVTSPVTRAIVTGALTTAA